MQREIDPQHVAEYEHASWERCARGYTDGFGPLVCKAIEPLLDAAEVSGGKRMLDVGTGPGHVAGAAAARGANVVGIDFSEAMLQQARPKYPGVEFRQASADALPFEDATFDAVVSNHVVHHLGRPEKAMEEAFRVLRSGAKIAFTVVGDPSRLEAFNVFLDAVALHGNPAALPHGPLFGVSNFDVFHGLVRNAGFRDSSVREIPIAWTGSSIDSLLAAFRDWADMDSFPEDVQSAIEATVRQKAKAYESDGVLTIPNPAILVSAIK